MIYTIKSSFLNCKAPATMSLLFKAFSISLGNYTQRPKLGRSCQLHTTKSREGTSFHNAYTQKGK